MSAANLSDVILAARYLMASPEETWPERCASLLARVRLAAEYKRMTGRVHALYGDGSISSCALRYGIAPMPARLNGVAFSALGLVIKQFCEASILIEPDNS